MPGAIFSKCGPNSFPGETFTVTVKVRFAAGRDAEAKKQKINWVMASITDVINMGLQQSLFLVGVSADVTLRPKFAIGMASAHGPHCR